VAPVLVCPECSTKHPLSTIGERRAFPCEGCGRTLKVPEAAATAVTAAVTSGAVRAAAPPASLPPERPAATRRPVTRVMPVVESPPPLPITDPAEDEPRQRPARDPIPPRWVRVLLWIVAIPLAFLVVLAFARATGMLTTNEISDLALAQGWGRFWPIARLLPFVALAAAAFVHGGAFVLTRVREQRWTEQDRAAAKAGGPPKSRTNGARPRPRGQSSRTRA
jgi:hypothetical protein